MFIEIIFWNTTRRLKDPEEDNEAKCSLFMQEHSCRSVPEFSFLKRTWGLFDLQSGQHHNFFPKICCRFFFDAREFFHLFVGHCLVQLQARNTTFAHWLRNLSFDVDGTPRKYPLVDVFFSRHMCDWQYLWNISRALKMVRTWTEIHNNFLKIHSWN